MAEERISQGITTEKELELNLSTESQTMDHSNRKGAVFSGTD